MPQQDLDRIFEPFFTTKDVWSNLGLGLFVSYRIIEDHGGSIRVSSSVDVGTTVLVLLPKDESAVDPVAVSAKSVP
jgi:signal transduction histidine kinase